MMLPVHVRMARAALGWTNRELADKANVNLNTVARYEAGREVKSRTIESIESVFTAAGITLIYEDALGGVGLRLTRELTQRLREPAKAGGKNKSGKRTQK
jgi:transcriptional regulator with XRE-family HTH domain